MAFNFNTKHKAQPIKAGINLDPDRKLEADCAKEETRIKTAVDMYNEGRKKIEDSQATDFYIAVCFKGQAELRAFLDKNGIQLEANTYITADQARKAVW